MKKQQSLAVNVFVIGFFEFFGTAIFGYCNLLSISYSSRIIAQTGSLLQYYTNFAFALFVAISYGRQFSGGVYNPAIVLFRMLRKTDRMPLKVGIIYQCFQICGGTFGSFVAAYLWDLQYAPIPIVLPGYQIGKKFGSEILSTFLLAFMVEIFVNKKTSFFEHNRQAFICIPLIFMTARGYAPFGNIVNPAFGVGFQLALAVKQNQWAAMQMCWIIIVGSYIGGLLAVCAFQFVYQPLYPHKKQFVQGELSKILQDGKQTLKKRNATNQQIQTYISSFILQALKLGIHIKDNSPVQLKNEQIQQQIRPLQKTLVRDTKRQSKMSKMSKMSRMSKRFGADRIASLGQGLTQQLIQYPFALQRKFTIKDDQQRQQFHPKDNNDDIESLDDQSSQQQLIKEDIQLDQIIKTKLNNYQIKVKDQDGDKNNNKQQDKSLEIKKQKQGG